jgi:uncharacterized protein (TIGR02646 family)
MRPVDRGAWPTDPRGAREVFTSYGDAMSPLIARLGRFCSYCEMRIDNVPAVEHVSPKRRDPERERDWDNLLLACVYCNARKGNHPKPSLLGEYCWPDRDNTFRAFAYRESGEVEINRALPDTAQALAMRLRALVGLNDRPREGQHLDAGDPRWQKRIRVWDIASEHRDDLVERDTPRIRERIVKVASETGCWSIWMTVFANDPDMRRRLLAAFPGTARGCFTEHGEALPRVAGAL